MTYRFQIDEKAGEPDILILHIWTHGNLTDVYEGPSRFVINRITSFYHDDLILQKRRFGRNRQPKLTVVK